MGLIVIVHPVILNLNYILYTTSFIVRFPSIPQITIPSASIQVISSGAGVQNPYLLHNEVFTAEGVYLCLQLKVALDGN